MFLTGEAAHNSAIRRRDGFCELAADEGVSPRIFTIGPRTEAKGVWTFEDQLLDLADMLREMPRPVGLFAFDAAHTWRALLACKRAGFKIPDDVALICGGDDDIVFGSLRPSVSGIAYDNERVGFEAGCQLHRLMHGESVDDQVLIPPLGVVQRKSTDLVAVEDDDVALAVRYIWEHVAEQLSVEDVLEALPISQRSLSRKFSAALGRSPSDEIRRSRIETARRLLATTDLPLVRVAMESGLPSQAQMNRYIKDATGMTPGEVRRRFK